MSKVTFSARKDPLLRPRRANGQRRDDMPDTKVEPLTAAARTATPRHRPRRPDERAVEAPAGVISIAPPEPDAPTLAPTREKDDRPAPSAAASAPSPRSQPEPARRIARGVQTSISLPPELWDTLDELGAGAGVSAGKLLAAILTANLPDTPTAAFAAVEALLRGRPADDGLQEERNYRLARDQRTRLDALATALGAGPRPQRSLLIHAIATAHMPDSSEHARELLTTQRLDALRASLDTSTD